MPDSPTSESDSPFVCDCKKSMRSACAGEPFFNEHEGKRYCVLHFPGEEKTDAFLRSLVQKYSRRVFNFSGVWFPNEQHFINSIFNNDADFSYATFNAEADFRAARFEGCANFRETKFRARLDCGGTTFFQDAVFYGATFDCEADLRWTTFHRAANFGETTFKDLVSEVQFWTGRSGFS